MMTYDGLVLAAVAAELKRSLTGGPIQQVRQHNDTDLTLEIRTRGRTYRLFMSVNARFPRVYTSASSESVPQTAPNFCMLLRKYIKGSFVRAVEQVGLDRVLQIHTEAPDGNRNVLVLEIMGKHSNLILLSDTGKILGAIKHVGSSVSRYRQILPGRDYVPPPGGTKENPIEISRESFDALWREGMNHEPSRDDVKHWLVAAFSGIGPFLAEEIMARADQASQEAVWDSLEILRQIVTAHDYAPVLVTDDRGIAKYAYPIPVSQFSMQNQHERQSIDETLDTLFRSLVTRDEFDAEYTGLETAIKRSIAWREQNLRDLDKALAEGRQADRYKQLGELIVASQVNIVKGQSSAKVVDYYDPEMSEIEIALDEKLTPKENAERYFRRYRKAMEGSQTAAARQSEIRLELETLKSEKDNLAKASSVETLRSIRQILTGKGLLRVETRAHVPGKREEPEFPGYKIRRVTSSAGLEILYGENSQSNDYLTTKVARPNDYWLHARSVTGAHVIIRTGNNPDGVTKSTIQEAAEVAAKNSEAKHSSIVAVDYTLKKYVRKRKGSATGLVNYEKERTIDVNPNLK